LYSQDGGANVGSTIITTLPSNHDPSGMACVGTNLVVISNEDGSIHYAPIADILAGTETWTKITTGLVAMHAPNAIWSNGRTFTWIAGDGGYVYFSADITAGVTVQTAGAQTVENLKSIHGIDNLHVITVGENNAVLYTSDGGAAWAAITGPNPGVDLNTEWMRSEFCWTVGAADGTYWFTTTQGQTWTQGSFPGTGDGSVNAIAFASQQVGYMAHTTSAPRGYILRTIDGGDSWYRLPEAVGITFPDNDKIESLAACRDNVNVVYGCGLGANATDGFAVKAA
jgi:photosystem II stability/assembly factor-like uncharacterized protein